MAANNGLAATTWKGYQGVWKHIRECASVTGMSTDLPFSREQTYTLVGFWLSRKNLKSKTISSYLSALRMIHITAGFPDVQLRTPTIELVLAGRANQDELKSRGKPSRLPITLSKLDAIRCLLAIDPNMPVIDKSATWAICCLAFWGCFRAGELVSKTSREIDPHTTLLREDVEIVTRTVSGKATKIMKVRLKSSKESRAYARGVVIEVFEIENTKFCPVKAFEKYLRDCGSMDPKQACFRKADGFAYRHQRLNSVLKTLLAPHVPYGTISGHSFRAGLASLMAQMGYSDESIKDVGRWTSSSFKLYVKLDRITRSGVAMSLAQACQNL